MELTHFWRRMKILNFNVSPFITSGMKRGTVKAVKSNRKNRGGGVMRGEGAGAINDMNNRMISGKYDTYASLFSVDNLLTE